MQAYVSYQHTHCAYILGPYLSRPSLYSRLWYLRDERSIGIIVISKHETFCTKRLSAVNDSILTKLHTERWEHTYDLCILSYCSTVVILQVR